MPSLLFGLSSLVLATTAIATAPVQDRQLHSLPPKQSSASSSSSLLPTTATSSSTTSSTPLSTTLATQTGGSARWELTTVFTQPTGCVGGITQYAGSLSTLDYWLNIPFPAPGVTSTSCFPQPLLASVTARDDLPPYENLVCPDQWGSFDYNSTYRICCPKGFGLSAPGLRTHTERPGLGAWCTSWAWPGTHAALTRYFTDGSSSVIDTTLKTDENWLVRATPFDGIVSTPKSSSAATSSSSHSSSSSTATSSTPKSTPATTTTTPTTKASSTRSTSTSSSWAGPTSIDQLPQCGKTCINNMLAKYKELGCGASDVACLCRAPDFNYGVHDCAVAACKDTEASTVISFETSYYCPHAMATGTHSPTHAPTPTAISDLPPCGQTCMNNMIGQYSQLGCGHPDPACLCGKPNFGYGVRDCANGACGTAVAPTVTNFASSHYCSPTPKP